MTTRTTDEEALRWMENEEILLLSSWLKAGNSELSTERD